MNEKKMSVKKWFCKNDHHFFTLETDEFAATPSCSFCGTSKVFPEIIYTPKDLDNLFYKEGDDLGV